MDLDQISDRLEIEALLVRYTRAIDTGAWDGLDEVFTPDAEIDYTATGGIAASYPEVKAWLAEILPNFPAYQHLLGNFDVRVDGDTAKSRTMCFNPMVFNEEKKQVMLVGIWYEDEFVRTSDGWRIARRVEVMGFNKMI